MGKKINDDDWSYHENTNNRLRFFWVCWVVLLCICNVLLPSVTLFSAKTMIIDKKQAKTSGQI